MTTPGNELPASLAANPIPARWLDFGEPGRVTVRVGKVELGQGIRTALAQVAAEELGVALDRVAMADVSTQDSPDEGMTAGSRSVTDSGTALGLICAEVRARCAELAATKLAVDPADVRVEDGSFVDTTGAAGGDYWTLADAAVLDRPATAGARRVDPRRWQVAGTNAARPELVDKLFGRPRFIHDLRLADMMHGRVVRPSGPGATLSNRPDVNPSDGLIVVRDGDFLGVVAVRDRDALAGARRLAAAARWTPGAVLPDPDDLRGFLRGGPTEDVVVARAGQVDRLDAPDVQGEYLRPFLAHASMAPSCAIARWDGRQISVWSHTQGPYPLRRAIAAALDKPDDEVTVHHVEGAGVFGQNGADDVAFDAVLLAAAVPGRPVKVTWSREDELTWSPFAPAMLVAVAAKTDDRGHIVSWTQDVWSNGHLGRPGSGGHPRLLAATHTAGAAPMPPAPDGTPSPASGSTRNSEPYYRIPNRLITRHRVLSMPVRTSALRSLGAHANVFAIESTMDELARRSHVDPLAYRLDHLDDPRARGVLMAVAQQAGWPDSPGGSDGIGRGIAFARYKNTEGYCAVVAEVEALTHVRLRRLWIAVDIGLVINPDGAVNQIQGGAIQAASWTLRERVTFDRHRVTSDNWDSYPILPPGETPEADVLLVASGEPSLGAGELAQGPVAGAIGNAVRAALDVRVYDLPLTAEHVAHQIART